jgi:hypothetical protein
MVAADPDHLVVKPDPTGHLIQAADIYGETFGDVVVLSTNQKTRHEAVVCA